VWKCQKEFNLLGKPESIPKKGNKEDVRKYQSHIKEVLLGGLPVQNQYPQQQFEQF